MGAITLAVGLFGIAYWVRRPDPSLTSLSPSSGISRSELDLRLKMRDLWEDHVAWSRMYLISAATEAPDVQETTERLLKNQVEIGEVIALFYGKKTGHQLTALFKDHIRIAGEMEKSVLSGNQKALNLAEQKGAENAEAIAVFLDSVNSHWSKEVMKKMMSFHVALFREQSVARFEKQYGRSMAKYDEMRKHALMMADLFSDGIIKQFPEKFTMESLSSCS